MLWLYLIREIQLSMLQGQISSGLQLDTQDPVQAPILSIQMRGPLQI